MASRRFRAADTTDEGAGDGRLPRYRLVVLAAAVGELVESAGGFLCDRARAGWEVSVHVAGPCDPRPLAILGISAREIGTDDVGSVIRGRARGTALAVGADLLARDPGIRDDVSRMVVQGLTEVTVWGRPEPGDIGRAFDPDAHPLSAAARAFKAHALLAGGLGAGDTHSVAPTETLFRLRGQAGRRLHSV